MMDWVHPRLIPKVRTDRNPLQVVLRLSVGVHALQRVRPLEAPCVALTIRLSHFLDLIV